jgi:hypothetical protein
MATCNINYLQLSLTVERWRERFLPKHIWLCGTCTSTRNISCITCKTLTFLEFMNLETTVILLWITQKYFFFSNMLRPCANECSSTFRAAITLERQRNSWVQWVIEHSNMNIKMQNGEAATKHFLLTSAVDSVDLWFDKTPANSGAQNLAPPISKVWSSHSGLYEELCLLGSDIV